MDPPDLSDRFIQTVNYTNGTLVQFHDVISYKCIDGYHFNSSYYKPGFELKCQETGEWEVPDSDYCVDPESRSAFPK